MFIPNVKVTSLVTFQLRLRTLWKLADRWFFSDSYSLKKKKKGKKKVKWIWWLDYTINHLGQNSLQGFCNYSKTKQGQEIEIRSNFKKKKNLNVYWSIGRHNESTLQGTVLCFGMASCYNLMVMIGTF